MIENLPKGAIPDSHDPRDYKAEVVMGMPQIDWTKEFRQPEPPNADQGSSDSCVGQAWSYYHWQLKNKDFSRRDVFSQIALAYGAEIRAGGMVIVNKGQQTQAECPDPKPQTPQNMRIRCANESLALDDKELNSFVLPNQQMNYLAQAIKDYKGFVFGVQGTNAGWQNLKVPMWPQPGTAPEWGHALYAFGYHTHEDGQKCIIAKSSWCDSGTTEHHIRETYFTTGNTFNAWTLIPNQTMQLIKVNGVVYLSAGTNNKVVTGIADGDVLAGLFGDEPIVDLASLPAPETQTLAKGFVIHKK